MPSTDHSWRELVERIDDEDRHIDSLYPYVYFFSGGRKLRDSGPTKGIYTP